MRKLSLALPSLLSLLCWSACAQEPTEGQGPGREGGGAEIDWTAAPRDGATQCPSDFVRFVAVGDGGHLDTAVTTYEKDGVEVVFYGAVHIADKSVYEELNDRFTTCDVLLYELVGPEDYRPGKDREERGFNPVSLLQNGLRHGLELSFQLDEIDYQVDNFVHADMTPQEFQSSMEERGESLLSIMFNMMAQGMQQQRAADEEGGGEGSAAEFDLVQAFRSGHGRHLLRMSFASQLEQMEMLAAGGEGSTLLEGRNEKCLQVLRREIDNGHRRLGIYYGAAHLPHLEMRLVRDLGFRKTGHEWLVAWDCKKRPDPKLDRELIKQRRLAKGQMAEMLELGRAYRRAKGDEMAPANVATLKAFEGDDGKTYEGPAEDPWGSEYRIEKRRYGVRWQVRSLGPDGESGTDDDIVVIEPRR